MPNWVDVMYKVEGDKHELEHLRSSIEYLKNLSEQFLPNSWDGLWLGCLVKYLGGDPDKMYCRGEITEYQIEDDVLSIRMNCAWGEMNEVRHFLEKYYTSIKIYYFAEGECDPYTNDKDGKYFPERYILDDEQDVWEEFKTLDDAVKYMESIYNRPFPKDVSKIKEILEEMTEGDDAEYDYIYFEEVEVVDD